MLGCIFSNDNNVTGKTTAIRRECLARAKSRKVDKRERRKIKYLDTGKMWRK
jgi:hypothetical protein